MKDRQPNDEPQALERQSRSARPIRISLVVALGAPLAWAAQLGIAYAMVNWSCASGSTLAMHLLSALLLALAIATTLLGWREWSRWRDAQPHEHWHPPTAAPAVDNPAWVRSAAYERQDPELEEEREVDRNRGRQPDPAQTALRRARFIALAGLMLSAFFVAVMLAQWIPMLLLDPCGA